MTSIRTYRLLTASVMAELIRRATLVIIFGMSLMPSSTVGAVSNRPVGAVVIEATARNQESPRRTEMLRDTLRSSSSLSRRAALGGVGAAAAAMGLSHVDRATAQDATATSLATHPLVGTWLSLTPGVTPHTFAADGSCVVGWPATEQGDPISGAQGVTYLGSGIG